MLFLVCHLCYDVVDAPFRLIIVLLHPLVNGQWRDLCYVIMLLIQILPAMATHSAFWSHSVRHITTSVADAKEYSDERYDSDRAFLVSMDTILPDDIIERILACLPIASIFRAGSVCKRWHDIVKSRRFLWNVSPNLPQKPWYFMFTCNETPSGFAYDPTLRKWYGGIDLPCIGSSSWIISSSCGLVSFMDIDSRSKIYVCNPITKRWRGLDAPPAVKNSYYSSLAISMDRKSQSYCVAVAKSKQVPDDFLRWDFSIHVYKSGLNSWITCVTEVLDGWRGGDESVICNGILYCLIYSAGGVLGNLELRHGLVMYDLMRRSSDTSLMRNSVTVPCPLTCGRLMNLQDKLILVGGIGKQDRADIIKGIGIWELDKIEWREVSRMPHRFFQGFGEFDDVFACSGMDGIIYIQSYGAPALLVFDMNLKLWKWSQKCPVTKRFPLQLFSGFCFEPRLDVSP